LWRSRTCTFTRWRHLYRPVPDDRQLRTLRVRWRHRAGQLARFRHFARDRAQERRHGTVVAWRRYRSLSLVRHHRTARSSLGQRRLRGSQPVVLLIEHHALGHQPARRRLCQELLRPQRADARMLLERFDDACRSAVWLPLLGHVVLRAMSRPADRGRPVAAIELALGHREPTHHARLQRLHRPIVPRHTRPSRPRPRHRAHRHHYQHHQHLALAFDTMLHQRYSAVAVLDRRFCC